jgi:hypothetical protein
VIATARINRAAATDDGWTMPLFRSRRLRASHVLGVLALVLALGGTATAATLITGRDVKDGSLTGADVKDASIKSDNIADGAINSAKLSDGVWNKIQRGDPGADGASGAQGATGSKGADGAAGATGATGARGATGSGGATGASGSDGSDGADGAPGEPGAQGPPGQSLIANVLTPPNPSYAGKGLVVVAAQLSTFTGPTITQGTEILPPTTLPEGRYLMQLTAQFFDFEQDGDGQAYPVIKTFLGGVVVATGWGSDIPDNDPNDASQGSGAQVIDVPAGGAELVNRAIVRGGSGTYQGGANLVLTALG